MTLMLLGGTTAVHAQNAADDAILSDPDFEKSLPPLEETMSGAGLPAASPAGPAPQGTPATPAAPGDTGAATSTDAEPALPDAVATDAQLSAPLPSLQQFDTEPANDVVVQDTRPPEIDYRVEVVGLSEVGLQGRFKELSALLRDGREAANATQVAARAKEDVTLADRLMRSEGYYDGVTSVTIDTLPNERNMLTVTLTATPGPRYVFDEIRVVAEPPKVAEMALQALNLKPGSPIVAARVEAAEARVSLRLPENGYPFATVGQRDILLDDRDHTGDYTLPVNPGPLGRYRNIITTGDDVLPADHLAMLARFHEGELYDSLLTDDLRQAVIATGLMSAVTVKPVATGESAGDGAEYVDIAVDQVEGPTRQLSASAGYGTGEGLKLQGGWTNRNMFPPEGALSAEVIAGTLEQRLDLQFKRSNAGQRDRAFTVGAWTGLQKFDAYSARTATIYANMARVSTPLWQKRWTWSLGTELIATRETRFRETTADRTRSTYLIVSLPGQVTYDRSDSLLNPTRGFRIAARVSPDAQKRTSGGYDFYVRTLGEVTGYVPTTKSLVLAGRARVGSILGAGRNDIAPSQRYYAGGGGSVRGYGYHELGPRDAEGDPVGGRSVTEFSLEARYRFGNYGIVPFIDAGRVGVSSTPSLKGMRYGAGIGARYYTDFGPLRLDVATPLDRQPGDPKIAVYVSIGQAF